MSLKLSIDQIPMALRELPINLEQLYYEGDLELLRKPYIAIVGAREVGPWAAAWLEHELAPVLKRWQIGVVSGGARGVDQLSHWMALRHSLPTLVVLPSGLSQKYPKSISKLEGHSQVGFLSEYQNDVPMFKHHFYKRNRLVCGLALATLIVQASERSGTIITAKYAIDYGRPVLAVPGHPMDVSMAGNNQLLFDGAYMVRGEKDLEGFIGSL